VRRKERKGGGKRGGGRKGKDQHVGHGLARLSFLYFEPGRRGEKKGEKREGRKREVLSVSRNFSPSSSRREKRRGGKKSSWKRGGEGRGKGPGSGLLSSMSFVGPSEKEHVKKGKREGKGEKGRGCGMNCRHPLPTEEQSEKEGKEGIGVERLPGGEAAFRPSKRGGRGKKGFRKKRKGGEGRGREWERERAGADGSVIERKKTRGKKKKRKTTKDAPRKVVSPPSTPSR